MDSSLGQELRSHVFQQKTAAAAELLIVEPTIVEQITAEPLIAQQMDVYQIIVVQLILGAILIQFVLQEFSATKNRLHILKNKGFHIHESLSYLIRIERTYCFYGFHLCHSFDILLFLSLTKNLYIMKKKKVTLGKLGLKKSKVASLESNSVKGGFQSWTGTAEPCFSDFDCGTNNCGTNNCETNNCGTANCGTNACPTNGCPPPTLLCNSHSVCPRGVQCY